MTPRRLILEAAGRLRLAGVPDPTVDAALLLAYLTGREPLELRLDTDTACDRQLQEAYDLLIRRRAERIPLQHLTGSELFCGYRFHTDQRALIPRPETELLVKRAAELIGNQTGFRVLDLCCGSGCIGISIALACPGAQVTACDLSPEALTLASENASALGADIRFASGDLFEAVKGQQFHLIVSNPPYIPSCDCAVLQPEVLHDPLIALDGGHDGLEFYRRITREAPGYLLPDGHLLLEIGVNEAEVVSDMLQDMGFSRLRVCPDLAGIPRMVEGSCNPVGET